jgi:hypothetical protein
VYLSANCGKLKSVAPQCLRFASALRSTRVTVAQLPLNFKKANYATSIHAFLKCYIDLEHYWQYGIEELIKMIKSAWERAPSREEQLRILFEGGT